MVAFVTRDYHSLSSNVEVICRNDIVKSHLSLNLLLSCQLMTSFSCFHHRRGYEMVAFVNHDHNPLSSTA